MRVFVTGAPGWIGSAVLHELVGAGHEVVGLVRSDSSALAVTAAGGQPVRGDLADLDTLRAPAARADGVVHLAFDHDFSRFEQSVKDEARVLQALGSALTGSGKPLVIASAPPPSPVASPPSTTRLPGTGPRRCAWPTPAWCSTSPGTVSGPPWCDCPDPCTARATAVSSPNSSPSRAPEASRVTSATGRSGGPRYTCSTPPTVPPGARQRPGRSVLHAVGDEGVPVRTIAEVIGHRLGLPTASRPAEAFGFLGGLLAVDQPASSAHTRPLPGWQPNGPGLVDDMDDGHYFR